MLTLIRTKAITWHNAAVVTASGLLVTLGFAADAIAFETGHHLAFILAGMALGRLFRR